MASIRTLYEVETDGADWPTGLTREEQLQMGEAVRRVLQERGPMELWVLYENLRSVGQFRDMMPDKWHKATVLSWKYACIERALHHIDAISKWHLGG